MNTNWKTTLGGALSTLGKSFIGVGILPQLAGLNAASGHGELLTWIAFAGFILDAFGGFFASLFAADAAALRNVQAQMLQVPQAISSGNTTMLSKSIAESKVQAPKTETSP